MSQHPASRCLRFSVGALDSIRAGRKRVTFRAGRRRFRVGEIVEGKCAEGVVLLLRITGCEGKALKDVSEEEALSDLFESKAAVLEGMRRFYPKMSWETEISVIRFELVRSAEAPEGVAGPPSGA